MSAWAAAVSPVRALPLARATYVIASAYAHDFMSTRVFGVVNVGILLGLLQFVTTVALTLTYARYAKRRLDPQVSVVRGLAGIVEE